MDEIAFGPSLGNKRSLLLFVIGRQLMHAAMLLVSVIIDHLRVCISGSHAHRHEINCPLLLSPLPSSQNYRFSSSMGTTIMKRDVILHQTVPSPSSYPSFHTSHVSSESGR